MYQEEVFYPKCHNTRKADLKIPCETCGAFSTIFGYLYQHEFRVFWWAIVIIILFVVLAIVSGIIFLVYQRLLISQVSSKYESIDVMMRLIPGLVAGGQS